jgi:hypothetical protein
MSPNHILPYSDPPEPAAGEMQRYIELHRALAGPHEDCPTCDEIALRAGEPTLRAAIDAARGKP